MLGKIHGLENIAYCDPKEIAACNGNPVLLQNLINQVEDVPRYNSHEEKVASMEQSLIEYQAAVENMNLQPSDKKKMLALPFYMIKRSEIPAPKRGQVEWGMFKEIYGEDYWNDLDLLERDTEEKITEFNFEKFFPEGALDGVDIHGQEFKNKIKMMNLTMRTKYEQHKDNQEQFKQMMPALKGLTRDEMRALYHKLQNDSRRFGAEHEDEIFDDMISGREEQRLAKLSEEENYQLKNRYRHQRKVMDFADKKRMPIETSKVRDLLRNQHLFREKIEKEMPTMTAHEENTQVENGVLTYLNEAAYGDMKALIRDVGINADTIEFYNLARLRQVDENRMFESDR